MSAQSNEPATDPWIGTKAPSTADMESIANSAYTALPKVLRDHVDTVMIRVTEFPDQDVLDELGIEGEFGLLGLYQGVSLDQKSLGEVVGAIDMIFLYRQPLLAYWCEMDETLDGLIRHVLIHEIGHHFGYSDADMDAIELAS
ncbi:MAG: metallopeptidase family protein [Alphaproteobacteria bacterium]|jgi:predicted Zn-dependent protease with MMP-like domain|nr:metallopeptidase family protein [Alphaproteobacteria bacterium]MBT5860031.1 metallopeptidase family protein [Alphaproteobacteria bacterium]